MKGVNKVILVGNLGSDPEVRYMPNGGPVATVSVATTDSWQDKSTGERQERTEWHRVVFFNRLAEIVQQYLRKGSQVYVEGNLRTNKWQKDGVDRYTTEIIAREMQMLGGRQGGGTAPFNQQSAPGAPAGQYPDNQQAAPPPPEAGYQSAPPAAPYSAPPSPQAQTPPASSPPPNPDEFNDDIPF